MTKPVLLWAGFFCVMTRSSQKTAYLYALAAILAWSTVSTAFKLSLVHLTSLGLLLFSSAAATIFLLVYIIVLKGIKPLAIALKDWHRSLLPGLLNPFVYYLMLFAAYDRLPAQEAQVLNYTWAIVLSVFSILILKERFRVKDLLALLLSFVGVIVISTRGQILQMNFRDPVGSLLAVSTSLVWASYWILNMKDKRPVADTLFLNFLIGTLATLCYCLISGNLDFGGLFKTNANVLLGLSGALYVGIFEMGLTFLLWQNALQKSSNTSSIANLIFVTPFLSLFFIALLLRESIHPATLIGLVIIIGSNIWQKHRPRQAD